MESEVTCTICTGDMDLSRQAILPNCKHEFCFECIVRWINISNTCPLDRSIVESIFVSKSNGNTMEEVSVVEFISQNLIVESKKNNMELNEFIGHLCHSMHPIMEWLNKLQNYLAQLSTGMSDLGILAFVLDILNRLDSYRMVKMVEIKTRYSEIVHKFNEIAERTLKHKIDHQELNGSVFFIRRYVALCLMDFIEISVNCVKEIKGKFFSISIEPIKSKVFFAREKIESMRIMKEHMMKALKTLILKDNEILRHFSLGLSTGDCIICNKRVIGNRRCQFQNCAHSICIKCVKEYSIYEGSCFHESNPTRHGLYMENERFSDISSY